MWGSSNNSALRTKTAIFSAFYVLFIALVISYIFMYTLYTDDKKYIPTYLNFVIIYYTAVLIKRIRMFLEELLYLETRYENNLYLLIKDVFYFSSRSVVFFLLFLSSYLVLLHYFVEDKWSTFILSSFTSQTAMTLCWLCFLDFLKWNECPVSTSIKLNEFHGLDYGSGMATSFFHGYLKIMLANTDGTTRNFLEFIELFQAQHKVVFDIKKMFILLPMSCECLPSLQNPFFPNIEESKSLDELEKDIAGTKKRIYKTAVYKIKKPNKERVYACVEYATPLRTFKEVISHNSKYSKIYEKYKNDIILNFYLTLKNILKEDPQCDNLCELIYYNDKYPDGKYKNVGNIVLKRIKEIKAILKSKKD